MRIWIVVVAAGCLAGMAAAQFVDEDEDAVVVEASGPFPRNPRQLPFFAASPVFRQQQPVAAAAVPVVQPQPQPGPVVRPPQYEPCITKEGDQGKCTTFKECYPYFKTFNLAPEEAWVMGSYNTCNFYAPEGRYVTGVCCGPPKPPPKVDPEEQKRDEHYDEKEEGGSSIGGFPIDFQQINTNCGKRSNFRNDFRIINGQVASINEFPFMAALLNRGRHFCGGALIDDVHILTAAHCVAHMSKYDVQNLKVVLGDHNLKQTGEERDATAECAVQRVIRHKRFDSNSLWNDVAILTCSKPVARRSNIQPICLDDNGSAAHSGDTVQVAGWGTTVAGGGASSSVLRKVDVRVWSNARCKSSYGTNAPGGIQDHMICASTPELKKDSCSGDSGGPLFKCAKRDGGCVQMGIVSWGIGCARPEYPGVYTRVAKLFGWVKRIAKKY